MAEAIKHTRSSSSSGVYGECLHFVSVVGKCLARVWRSYSNVSWRGYLIQSQRHSAITVFYKKKNDEVVLVSNDNHSIFCRSESTFKSIGPSKGTGFAKIDPNSRSIWASTVDTSSHSPSHRQPWRGHISWGWSVCGFSRLLKKIMIESIECTCFENSDVGKSFIDWVLLLYINANTQNVW